jgi:hypothetical protein
MSPQDYGASFLQFEERESQLRRDYIVFQMTGQSDPGEPDRERLLRGSAHFLELTAISACTHEILDRTDPTQQAEPGFLTQMAGAVRQLCGLDPIDVTTQAYAYFGPPPPSGPGATTLARSAIVRLVRSIAEVTPIDELEGLGATLGAHEWSFRCRVAFDAIWAFLFRNDAKERSRLTTVGLGYAEGRMGPTQAASLLGVEPTEAIALLEMGGFRRTLETITLADEDRAERLLAMRHDRLARDGAPQPNPELLARDVLASQRLEGIDARPWLPTSH